MSSWAEVEREAPELAQRVRRIFDGRKHKTLATLRRDGSPRVSGIEVQLVDGEATFGMSPRSVKLADVRRDPRIAIHALSDDVPDADPNSWDGDAKLSGTAIEVREGAFRIDIDQVVLTHLADGLVTESWRPGRGVTVYRR